MPPLVNYVEELSRADVEILTGLLILSPHQTISPIWLFDQAYLLESFPAQLLRPSNFLARLVTRLPIHIPGRAVLCRSHRTLNALLIRRLFLLVIAECTTKLARLERALESLHVDMAAWLRRLQSLNSLWTRPDLFRVMYYFMPEEGRKEYVESGCEACILARIGGDVEAIRDLRAAVLGRRRKRAAQPRLMAVLDGWVSWAGERDRINAESDDIAEELRAMRRELQRDRRQRREAKNLVARGEVLQQKESDEIEQLDGIDDIEDNVGEEDRDAAEQLSERDIISYYRDLRSQSSLHVNVAGGPSQAQEDEMHPAFRDTIIFEPVTGTFQRRPREHGVIKEVDEDISETSREAPPRNQRRYSESVYSQHPSMRTPSPSASYKAEERAKAYRRLIGITEPGEELSSPPRWANPQTSQPVRQLNVVNPEKGTDTRRARQVVPPSRATDQARPVDTEERSRAYGEERAKAYRDLVEDPGLAEKGDNPENSRRLRHVETELPRRAKTQGRQPKRHSEGLSRRPRVKDADQRRPQPRNITTQPRRANTQGRRPPPQAREVFERDALERHVQARTIMKSEPDRKSLPSSLASLVEDFDPE